MASKTKIAICNLALRSLGADRIMAIDEDNETARILNDVYDLLLDEVLRAHPWNFAQKRTSLARLDKTPAFDYDYAYQLPSDCLRVVRMSDKTAKFKIENNELLTNKGEAKILYIARITDPNLYDSAFITAFATRLASEISYPITNSQSLGGQKYSEYLEKLKLAKSLDAQEGTLEKVDEDSWIEERG